MSASIKVSPGARKSSGSSITEFAPALFIILIIVLFPFIDMVAMGLGYCCASMLNSLQLREAAVSLAQTNPANPTAIGARDTAGAVKNGIVNNWKGSGLGQFTNASNIITKVNYLAGANPDGQGPTDVIVEVRTTVTITPFLTMPFFPGVPGLGAPMTYSYASQQLLENPQNYNVSPWNQALTPPRATGLPSFDP